MRYEINVRKENCSFEKVQDKFSKLYVKDIEHRAQTARSTYFEERRAQIFIFDGNVSLIDIKLKIKCEARVS